ncbi:MAG: DUF4326 domain-containing protein [Sulfuriferula sp.]
MESKIVLIAYPPEFGCLEKFKRKANRILSSLNNFTIIYLEDRRGFIESTFRGDQSILKIERIDRTLLGEVGITHAIIFGDGQTFIDLIDMLDTAGAVVRRVAVKITRVVNVDKGQLYDEYIGRGTDWGNPYAIGFSGDREEVIRKYKYDFDKNYIRDGYGFKQRLRALAGKRLGCHCKPLACHGDVFAEYLNCLDDGE